MVEDAEQVFGVQAFYSKCRWVSSFSCTVSEDSCLFSHSVRPRNIVDQVVVGRTGMMDPLFVNLPL
jgi:hypothetical protein